jgi:hypothetical protein
MNRSLDRISEHLKALKAIHAALNKSRDGKSFLARTQPVDNWIQLYKFPSINLSYLAPKP